MHTNKQTNALQSFPEVYNYNVLSSFFCSCSWMKVDGDEYKLRTGVIVEVIDDMLTIGVTQKFLWLMNINV